MAFARDTSITAEAGQNASAGMAYAAAIGPAGVWTLDGEALVAADSDGPATVLVPTESVRLLAVDLPIANRAKRLAALPFAIEDLIAEPVDSVHIALGREIGPKRYLVGVVRHAVMATWIARLEDAGLDHAALVPDALALPTPAEGEWAVDLGATRAVVRASDGTGFAVPAPLLGTAWTAAGQPPAIAYGAPLPGGMAAGSDAQGIDPLARRVLSPALDLRQGIYARRRRGIGSYGKRLAILAAVAITAHVAIAAADTLMLQTIASRRANETRTLVAQLAPGASLSDDLANSVTDLLPRPGATGGTNAFLPVATRMSTALAPLSGSVPVKAMSFSGGVITMTVDSADQTLATRIQSALRDGGVQANVAVASDGIRITANAA